MSASYLDEIMEQPSMLLRLAEGIPTETSEALAIVHQRLERRELDRVVITGMGSSLYGGYLLWLQLTKALPVPVLLTDCSELVQQVPETLGSKSLLIAISQSGESGEIVELTRIAAQVPNTVIAITNLEDNTLSNWADIRLYSKAGRELTVSSKSHTGGLACQHYVATIVTGRSEQIAQADLKKAADASARLLQSREDIMNAVATHLDPHSPIMFIGRGNSLSSAQLASLLTSEASKLPCTALSGGQFRHGPIELVRSGFSMVAFLGDRKTREIDMALIGKVLTAGGRVLAISPDASRPEAHTGLNVISYPDVPHALTPLMEAMFVQLMQIPLAQSRGFVAGVFVNATKVTGIV